MFEASLGITKTCLYNFDPLKPHFYIVKLGFSYTTVQNGPFVLDSREIKIVWRLPHGVDIVLMNKSHAKSAPCARLLSCC